MSKVGLAIFTALLRLSSNRGVVAQLAERMDGIHEVKGSTPFNSTIL